MVALGRREILNPQTAVNQLGTVIPLVRVTLHALQRMIQRGFVLTENEEISFSQLLECLVQVWARADHHYYEEGVLPVEYKIEYEGAIFVIKAHEDYQGDVAMTLVTMLPTKK
jgi:TPP-dependent indolepyruvate ferredoxin oxidoreductase alpha subunit